MIRKQLGQTAMEYALIFAVVSAVIVTMSIYAKRGVQAFLKVAADDMASPLAPVNRDPEAAQFEGMKQEAGDNRTEEFRARSGTVLSRDSVVTTTDDGTVTNAEGFGLTWNRSENLSSQTAGSSASTVVVDITD
jgi:Flp pilus assembly pilin Flp